MYTICDCYKRHEEHPHTFKIPSDAVIAELAVGDYAKLIFETDTDGERMWVKITEREGQRFRGTLANRPVVIGELVIGDSIGFEARHIADVQRP